MVTELLWCALAVVDSFLLMCWCFLSAAWFRFWLRFILSLICGSGIGAAIPIVTLGAGVGLVYVSVLPMLTRRRQLAAQCRQEKYLIEP